MNNKFKIKQSLNITSILSSSFFKDSSYMVFSTVAMQLISILTIPILARLFSPESFGTPATSASSSSASVISSSHASTTEPVAYPPPTECSFKCNNCDLTFKNDEGLKIHIGKTHKSFDLKTPEKERSISVIEEPSLNLTPVNSCRREDEAVNEDITTDIQES